MSARMLIDFSLHTVSVRTWEILERFAMQEAMILIVRLLRHYRFDYAGDDVPWPKMRITIQPENDMPMRVKRRK